MYLTRAQRVELKRLWLERVAPESTYIKMGKIHVWFPENGMSYRAFRKTVTPLIAGQGCVMVCVKGLWFGIETNGDRHT